MKTIFLRRDGHDLLGSDGMMKIDGRYGIQRTIEEVRDRNKSYEKNFPHKIATSFYYAGAYPRTRKIYNV